MHAQAPSRATRDRAVACARRLFYRPEPEVEALVASFRGLAADAYPDRAAIVHLCHDRPLRIAATRAVFKLRILHWPMLNLTDAAERDRRAFAEAMADAIAAARDEANAVGAA